MRELVGKLIAALERQRPVAYCRLVETRGSTPQKAGATMLIFADGTQAGTLGGGCVEAEVKRRAIQVLDGGQPVVATYQLDSDYGWDDGLICGGRMQVLIQPVSGPRTQRYFERLGRLIADGRGVTEAVVFDAEASGLAAPAQYLFDADGNLTDVLPATASNQPMDVSDPHADALRDARGNRTDEASAGAAPARVVELLKPLSNRPRPYASHGIAFLPVLPRCRLIIVGGGHVGKAVADMASDLDFEVWIVDDREEYVSGDRFPRVDRRVHGPVDDVLPALEITPDTYCLIVTRGHQHDQRALYHLADRGARYVGLIGSRRKIKLIFEDLKNEGISIEALRAVHAPVGLDIGSQTVPEIAISICAELVAHRNLGIVPARPRAVEIA